MLFNSITFLFYLPIVFGLYWFVCNRNLRLQNLLVVVVSYVFYGWWDWRFLGLIAFTSAWSYVVGMLELRRWDDERGNKFLLAVSLIVNLGILAYFKYFNFFVGAASDALQALGFSPNMPSLNVILPVGISFYTFQALSYTIDVYRRQIVPTRDPVAFFAFISFFPQLVAGPIERATNLLPQFQKPRQFDYAWAVEGCRQMVWGFVKKVLIADNCAVVANAILNDGSSGGVRLWIGMIFFTFQIYGDFSGYSDIAIGCSKLFGIRLMRNFEHPYFARDIAEFWRRWHISLTTWFRDYLYIPLGGSRCGTWKKVRNTFAIFLVSGFWHGANWTFVLWGAFHAVCFLPLLLLGKNRKFTSDVIAQGRWLPTGVEFWGMMSTFFLAVVGWTLFRAPDVGTAFTWFKRMFGELGTPSLGGVGLTNAALPLVVFLVIEWFNRSRDIPALPKGKILRWCVYCTVVMGLIFLRPQAQAFIYFAF